MEKIFEQAKDLHVVGTKVYAVIVDDALRACADSDGEHVFTAAELHELYVKGCFVYGESLDGESKPFLYDEGENNEGELYGMIAVGVLSEVEVPSGAGSSDTYEVVKPIIIYSSEYISK